MNGAIDAINGFSAAWGQAMFRQAGRAGWRWCSPGRWPRRFCIGAAGRILVLAAGA